MRCSLAEAIRNWIKQAVCYRLGLLGCNRSGSTDLFRKVVCHTARAESRQSFHLKTHFVPATSRFGRVRM
jgi:hypothetical protein